MKCLCISIRIMSEGGINNIIIIGNCNQLEMEMKIREQY